MSILVSSSSTTVVGFLATTLTPTLPRLELSGPHTARSTNYAGSSTVCQDFAWIHDSHHDPFAFFDISHAVAREIAKGFKPASSERAEGLFLKDPRVESVSVVDEVLKMFEAKRRSKRRVLQRDSRSLWIPCVHR